MPNRHWFAHHRQGDSDRPATATSRPSSHARPDPDTAGAPEPRQEPAAATRAGGVWAAMVAVVLLAVVLIVFLLSNTAQVEVSFLGLRGELPLAIALLIAMVAGIVITLILAATHLTRLRHRVRRRQ